jgi:hypothetical protein
MWAVPVPSCAGAYVSGDLDSNECPAGSVRIATEAACRTAAAAAGKSFSAVATMSERPRGCFYYTEYNGGNNAFFNADAVGAGDYFSRLLCAALTTGAPLHAPTRVCCAVLAGGASNDANGLNRDTHALYTHTHTCAHV